MPQLLSLATQNPGCAVSAAAADALLGSVLRPDLASRAAALIAQSGIRTRCAVAPLDDLRRPLPLGERGARSAAAAVDLAEGIARRALAQAAVDPAQVAVAIGCSSTASSVPPLDLHLANRLRLAPDAVTLTLSGLGCGGAVRAAGLAARLLQQRATPGIALVVAVELCSFWLPTGEWSPDDLATAVAFGDGAGALVLGHDSGPGAPEILAGHSLRWPNTLQARGARLTSDGWRHTASPRLGHLVARHLRNTVDAFLAGAGLTRQQLGFIALNPSDARLHDIATDCLGGDETVRSVGHAVWAVHGNTLAVGPIYTLAATHTQVAPAPGDFGLLLAFGPGITCELLLVRWREGLATGHWDAAA